MLAVLRMKDSDDWGPEQKGALRSLLAGRQWTQQRLQSAKLVDSSLCQLCLGMPGGDQVGSLIHRCLCPAQAGFLSTHGPLGSSRTWLFMHAGRGNICPVRPF